MTDEENNTDEVQEQEDQDEDSSDQLEPGPEIELKALVEAIIFASLEPISIVRIKKILRGEDKDKVKTVIKELQDEYSHSTRGVRIFEVAGGYHIRTAPELSKWVGKLFESKPHKLTQASIETLAIIAYKQPITRPEVEELRGVDCGGVVKTLLERNFIKILGRQDVPGRPLIYGTTKEFLEFFNLESLSSLPTLKELSEFGEVPQSMQQSEDTDEVPAYADEDVETPEGESPDDSDTGDTPNGDLGDDSDDDIEDREE